MTRNEAKLHASLVALGLGGLVIIVMAWFASQSFATRMADLEAQRRAVKWSERALTSLQWGKPTFDQAQLSPADKARLHDLLMASDIYRYVLYHAEGTVFWSSKLSKIGKKVEGSYFAGEVAKGSTFVKAETKKASEIDGLLWRKGTLGLDPNSERTVIEVYVPVVMTDRFVGAIEVYVDTTDLIAFYAHHARTAAALLSGAFGLIFLAVASMMLFYARERRANIRALTAARDEALEMASELQRVNDDVVKLNRDLADNMRKLSAAQDEVVRKAKLAQLGQLTATVAHEIRNPLGTVRTAAYLIERKLKGQGTGLEQPLQRIGKGIVRCDNIITQLLDFARSDSLRPQTQAVDDWVAIVVREEAEKLPPAVAVECRLGVGSGTACFDSGPMQRVLINLLSNAAEAMAGRGDGPGSLAVAAAKIVVSTRTVPRGIEIEVADNGCGIAPENMSRILEPLFTTKSFGVGLGLPAVRKILEQHGGGLEVRSGLGEGTTVVAWFPNDQANREAA